MRKTALSSSALVSATLARRIQQGRLSNGTVRPVASALLLFVVLSAPDGVNASRWVLVSEGFASARNTSARRGVALAPEGGALATAINNRGDIVGLADDGSGNVQVVMWRLHP